MLYYDYYKSFKLKFYNFSKYYAILIFRVCFCVKLIINMKFGKKVSIGSWVTIGHPSIVEIMAEAGFDWYIFI